jgi:hypothetical protein
MHVVEGINDQCAFGGGKVPTFFCNQAETRPRQDSYTQTEKDDRQKMNLTLLTLHGDETEADVTRAPLRLEPLAEGRPRSPAIVGPGATSSRS